MLTSLRIQNFRSIRDASVKLGQANLFIGPNNSGKSNFLKGIVLAADIIEVYPSEYNFDVKVFQTMLIRSKNLNSVKPEFIKFIINSSQKITGSASIIVEQNGLDNVEATIKLESSTIPKKEKGIIKYSEELPSEFNADSVIFALQKQIENTCLYDINPIFSRFSHDMVDQNSFNSDGSNIISFLFSLSQNHRGKFRKLETDLALCVGDLVSIGTPLDPEEAGKLKLKFFDQHDNSYWAEEVSEGVLYFLAILCIVHQPDPPKLLLLEEPEKGIHPRRIKEVMDFIFELARLRDIQIILTSHSPYVVDYFADIPECISVFDREGGETVIHNAGDIINETNDKLKAAGQEPIRYTDSLGEHWVSGFLGGVPV